MRIYSMTATFGKLEHETLTLKPGFNIIEAPNEWGKSTWCAFLTAMLYGIDTGSRTTKNALAEKERYTPWSGSPMSGRIELHWQGRDITIERRSKGRVVFGDFRAYETASGMEIPELTASNCGQLLLGVEKNVFLRAGFLKLNDLPVTQDDALRRRLNALVTTGDESGSGDRLAQRLKELKNKCRYNRSGLLPQAEAQLEDLHRKLNELSELNNQIEKTHQRHAQLTDMISQLQNHKDALLYEESKDVARQITQAEQDRDDALAHYQSLFAECDGLPSREEAAEKLGLATELQQQWVALQASSASAVEKPIPPEIPAQYASTLDPVAAAKEDYQKQAALEAGKKRFQRFVYGAAILVGLIGIIMAVLRFSLLVDMPALYLIGCAAIACIGIGTLTAGFLRSKRTHKELTALYDRHPGLRPQLWVSDAEAFVTQQHRYRTALQNWEAAEESKRSSSQALQNQLQELAGDISLSDAMDRWRESIAHWDAVKDAKLAYHLAEKHASALRAIAKPVAAPQYPDQLNGSLSDTEALLSRATQELQQNQLRLGQLQGQADSLGLESQIRKDLMSVQHRITQLEDTYQALELAQRALSHASSELQRRFAPRISKRTQELFSQLTGGRYQRITLDEDMSLRTGTEEEDTIRLLNWRSDGTVDQLYLALRLAVSEELTPSAPLVLDDALVRFDDSRLSSALQILEIYSQTKQVLLFTCQSREIRWSNSRCYTE